MTAKLADKAARAKRWAAAALLIGLVANVVLGVFGGGAASAQTEAKQLFGAESRPAPGAPAIFGGYARGCLAGAVALAAAGPGWRTMRPSRNRAWGHPNLIAFVVRLSNEARTIGWPGLLIGDLSQPRGGPMLFGHASHQIGIDVDIWLRPAPDRPMTETERETMSAVSVVSTDNRTLTSDWTPEHLAVLRAAASDPEVARIFVHPAIKARLCADADPAAENRVWLRRIRPWWGHNAHFHVRLHCPGDSPNCRAQAEPPVGDGCGEVANWFEAMDRPRRASTSGGGGRGALTLADLPGACAEVLDRPAQ